MSTHPQATLSPQVGEQVQQALTYDDVSLVPQRSAVLPPQVDPSTIIAGRCQLKIPFLSAAMDTVTEADTAIAMAQNGGLGVIHKNVAPADQASMVRQVKRFEAGVVKDPITLSPQAPLSDAFAKMQRHGVSGFPVVDKGQVVGILTHRDLRLSNEPDRTVAQVMTTEVVTVPEGISREDSLDLMHKNRIEKLLVVDDNRKLLGLITFRDLQKVSDFPDAARDSRGRLTCAAAVTPGPELEERSSALMAEGCDILVVDTAHGHSQGVIDAVGYLKSHFPDVGVIAGNIATAQAAEDLAQAGADAVKVGIGPGSICTTRIVAGVGVPQISAIFSVSPVAKKHGISLIADGGIKFSGDCVKALAAGADAVMLGSLFAGTKEAPGEMVLLQGRSFKVYRGMGSQGAMGQGSADRYGQGGVKEARKLVPEGIEGRVPYRGPLRDTLYQLVGGVRAGMGYLGAPDLQALRTNAHFVRVTAAGLKESHVHDVIITKEAPNYWVGG